MISKNMWDETTENKFSTTVVEKEIDAHSSCIYLISFWMGITACRLSLLQQRMDSLLNSKRWKKSFG